MIKKIATIIFTLFTLIPYVAFATLCNTNSISTDGTNMYLSVAAAGTALGITGDFTIETWLNPAATPANNAELDFFLKGTATTVDYRFIYLDWTGTGGFVLYTSFKNGANSSAFRETSTSNPLANNTWTHVAASCTVATPTCTIYRNGTAQGMTTSLSAATAVTDTAASTVRISSDGNNDSRNWNGLLDDVRVYNIARTGAEIASDYNQELVGNETGLVGYWKLNNALTDSTSNGFTLTNTNSVTFSTNIPFVGTCPATIIPKRPDIIWIW